MAEATNDEAYRAAARERGEAFFSEVALKRASAFGGQTLKSWLKERIEASGLAPAELADKAEVNRSLIYRFVNDQRDLSLDTIDKLLPHLDLAIGEKLRAGSIAVQRVDDWQDRLASIEQLAGSLEEIDKALERLKTFVGVLRSMDLTDPPGHARDFK